MSAFGKIEANSLSAEYLTYSQKRNMLQSKYTASNILPVILPSAALKTSLRLLMPLFLKNAFITKYKTIYDTELIIGATQAAVFAASEQELGKILIEGDSTATKNRIKTCLIEILPLHLSINPHSAAAPSGTKHQEYY